MNKFRAAGVVVGLALTAAAPIGFTPPASAAATA